MPNNEQVRPSILIVDDDREERRLLTDLLRRQQYQVRAAADGSDGYQSALATRPDLILLDVRMPRLDGFAACRLLKANPVTATIPVIFLSALDEPDERVAGLVLGGVDFIAKPYNPPEVFARVRIHLELASQRGVAVAAAQARAGAASASSFAVADAAGGTAAASVAAVAEAPPHQPHHPDEVIAVAAMRLIADNLALPLTLADIAHAIGTYEKRLSQAFRAHAGMTVFAYLGEERIARGRQLLAETDMSVQQVAEQTGFRSAANFATAFRERLDMTPTTYRQAMRQATIATIAAT